MFYIDIDQYTKLNTDTEHYVTSHVGTKTVFPLVEQINILIHHLLKHLVKTIVEMEQPKSL